MEQDVRLGEAVEVFVDSAKEIILAPPRLLLSKPARRAYINTILVSVAALIFAFIAAAAYIYLYWTSIPHLSFSRIVHLEFHPTNHMQPSFVQPYGSVDLEAASLISRQEYDVTVELYIPRTDANREMGNFMVDVKLLRPEDTETGKDSRNAPLVDERRNVDAQLLACSRRPAILTYRSPMVELASSSANLPLLLLGWKQEAESLKVPMFEGISFSRGWRNVPNKLVLELNSPGGKKLEVYSAHVHFTARLTGLRWIMYNWWLQSFLVFSTAFWTVEMLTAVLIWLIVRYTFGTPQRTTLEGKPVKTADTVRAQPLDVSDSSDYFSDTSRSYPTYSSQPPLHYSSQKKMKLEDGFEGEDYIKAEDDEPGMLQEADIEDEDEDGDYIIGGPSGGQRRSDSGLGTSMESSTGRGDGASVRRRRSKGPDV